MNETQKLQDMLAGMQEQRNNAMNVVVLAQAEIAALKRALTERDAKIESLKADLEKLKPAETKPNGADHANEAAGSAHAG